MIVLVVLLLVLCLCISIIAYRGTVSMSTIDITKKEYGKRVVTDASKVSLLLQYHHHHHQYHHHY